MVHLTVGLFKHEHEAGNAIAALKDDSLAKDISIIAKDDKTGRIHLHQVKEGAGAEEMAGSVRGAELGAIAGIVGGISTIINPAFAAVGIVGALAAAMGVMGAAVGATAGGFVGALNDAGLPPERAKMYEDSIKRGELFVCVSSAREAQAELMDILTRHGAVNVHSLEAKE